MKKVICSIALVTAIAGFASAQNSLSDVAATFTGRWTWVSYSGGADKIAPTEANCNYMIFVRPDESGTPFTFKFSGHKNGGNLFMSSLTISEDPSYPAFPYKINSDLTGFLFNAVPLPSVNFRVLGKDSIEFAHPDIWNNYRFIFKHSVDTGGDGCNASFELPLPSQVPGFVNDEDASCSVQDASDTRDDASNPFFRNKELFILTGSRS